MNNSKSIEEKLNNAETYKYFMGLKGKDFNMRDLTWLAQKTYGWNCGEIISLEKQVETTGEELKEEYLIDQIVGTYQIAHCSDGKKLRIYPRKENYPMITNINGGWK